MLSCAVLPLCYLALVGIYIYIHYCLTCSNSSWIEDSLSRNFRAHRYRHNTNCVISHNDSLPVPPPSSIILADPVPSVNWYASFTSKYNVFSVGHSPNRCTTVSNAYDIWSLVFHSNIFPYLHYNIKYAHFNFLQNFFVTMLTSGAHHYIMLFRILQLIESFIDINNIDVDSNK